MKMSEARELRKVIESAMQSSTATRTDDENIKASSLYPEWVEGSHATGEVYNAAGQTWECYQAYDNTIYPDIIPGNAAWHTFNRPLHGKTKETARPWVAPTGAHDMYKSGEYMIWTDGVVYQCIADTAYSPVDYAAAWSAGA